MSVGGRYELTCDKCGRTEYRPSLHGRTCNGHTTSGYCQGTICYPNEIPQPVELATVEARPAPVKPILVAKEARQCDVSRMSYQVANGGDGLESLACGAGDSPSCE
jgi:hypothetical protein